MSARTLVPPTSHDADVCDWCDRFPDRPCPACATRRRRAVRLVEQQGVAVEAAAVMMSLTPARVRRLLADEEDRRALAALRRDRVPNAPLRRLFAQARLRDPELTVSELARRLGSSPIQVERWLGRRATAPKTDRDGRHYPARTLTEIDVGTAGRIARALGSAPREIDGC